ncbi:hypothetical protein WMF04_24470 [Sorangium sp. So ce260]|uniref:hypothetical protein n=1 Tax=Sorangium sp. So ce260 TaxID=3133291 RepID=UPI003F5EAA18
MGKARPPSTRRPPWQSESDLKREVLAHCETKFLERFGRPWDPAFKTELIAEQRRLFAQDQEARELLEDLRRTTRKIQSFLERQELVPLDDIEALPGNSARTVGLAVWFDKHGRSVGSAEEDAGELPPYPESLRSLVMQRWAQVDPQFLPYPPQPPPPSASANQESAMVWRSGSDNQTRELSDGELAVVSILCGSWPKVNQADLEAGISVGKVIDRERVNVKNARKHLRGPR